MNIPKIYIMGDIHGRFQPVRDFWLRAKLEQKMTNNREDQTLILLGDVGINYFINERDDNVKEKLGKYPFTYFLIRGNHEERPSNLAMKNPEDWEWQEYFGGPVLVEKKYPYIKYASDIPEVYHIPYATEDSTVKTWTTLVLPGAYSVDKYYRIMRGLNWFKDEQMTKEEKDCGLCELDLLGYKCDIVLSHTCPIMFEPVDLFLSIINQSTVDKSMEQYLGQIEYNLNYKLWCFGHYHAFRDYPRTDGKKKIMLFQEAINLEQVMYNDIVEVL